MQVCINCNTSLSIGIRLHFCPFCGTPQLEKKLIYNRSTKDFNPRNPKPWRYKPWNDIPKLPKRNYIIENKTNQHWIAVMKKPVRDHINKHKHGRKKELIDISPINNNTNDDDIEVVNVVDDFSNTSEIRKIENEIQVTTSETLDIFTENIIELYHENIYPVAVYEANWLPFDDMIVNISLVEQTLGKSNHNIYWLRIALQSEQNGDINNSNSSSNDHNMDSNGHYDNITIESNSFDRINNEHKEQDDSSSIYDDDLYIVGMLSNDAAKYMLPNPYDWVELHAINANEFYMGQHMQKILYDIALRITMRNYNELAIQQIYTINIRKRAGIGKINNKYYRNKLQNNRKDINKQFTYHDVLDNLDEYQLWMSSIIKNTSNNDNNKQNNNNNDNNINPHHYHHNVIQSKKSINFKNNHIMNFKFHDFSIEVTHKLVLTRGLTKTTCLSRIRLSIYYENKLTHTTKIEKNEHELSNSTTDNNDSYTSVNTSTSNNTTNNNNNNNNNTNDSDATKRLHMFAMTDEEFANTKKITHISLYIIPIPIHCPHNYDILYPTADITLDIVTIQYIFRKEYPLGIDLNILFALNDKRIISKFIKQLACYIRLEYTDVGIKYAFIGSFSEPSYVTQSWPIDQIDNDICDYDNDIVDNDNDTMLLPLDDMDISQEQDIIESKEDIITISNTNILLNNNSSEEEIPVNNVEKVKFDFTTTTTIDYSIELDAVDEIIDSIPTILCPTHNITTCSCLRYTTSINNTNVFICGEIIYDITTIELVDNNDDKSIDISYLNKDILSNYMNYQEVIIFLWTIKQHKYALHCINQFNIIVIDSILPSLFTEYLIDYKQLHQLFNDYLLTNINSLDIINKDLLGNQVIQYNNQSKSTLYIVDNETKVMYINIKNHKELSLAFFKFIINKLDLFLSRNNKIMKLQIKM